MLSTILAHISRFFGWYFILYLLLIALVEHLIDEYWEERQNEREFFQNLVDDCHLEGGTLVHSSDLSRVREAAEEDGIEIYLVFVKAGHACVAPLDSTDEDDDE